MTSRPNEITDSHLRRKAIAYLRQSSSYQVTHNTGSTALQRDLTKTLESWGWAVAQIETVDEDLGVSGSIPGFRRGLDWVIEQMKAGVVGIVAVYDINRLCRNRADYFRFAEAAERQNVLLAHGDRVVDLTDTNDSFITLILAANAVRENQARTELSKRARRKKAEEGHASTPPPKGYVSAGHGQWVQDPDPQLREVISLVFDLFLRLGSAGAVIRALSAADVQMPSRIVNGVRQWRPAVRHEVHRILTNPAYKGTYIFGKERSDGSVSPKGRRGSVKCPVNEWVYIENHHAPYVAPHLWEQIQQQLSNNTARLKGPLGRGDALVQGILKCALHDRTLATRYPTRQRQSDGTLRRLARYFCVRGHSAGVSKCCCGITAGVLDAVVERELFKVLTPPSIDCIRNAAREALREYDALVRARADQVRRAEQKVIEAERAFGQVTADQVLLRQRFGDKIEVALREVKTLKASHRLHPLTPPYVLDEAELVELRGLLADLPALWRHESVTAERRKTIARAAIKAVYVTPRPDVWDIDIEWVGGARTRVPLSTRKTVRREVETALADGLTYRQTADRLNAMGFLRRRGHTTGTPYNAQSVRRVRRSARGE